MLFRSTLLATASRSVERAASRSWEASQLFVVGPGEPQGLEPLEPRWRRGWPPGGGRISGQKGSGCGPRTLARSPWGKARVAQQLRQGPGHQVSQQEPGQDSGVGPVASPALAGAMALDTAGSTRVTSSLQLAGTPWAHCQALVASMATFSCTPRAGRAASNPLGGAVGPTLAYHPGHLVRHRYIAEPAGRVPSGGEHLSAASFPCGVPFTLTPGEEAPALMTSDDLPASGRSSWANTVLEYRQVSGSPTLERVRPSHGGEWRCAASQARPRSDAQQGNPGSSHRLGPIPVRMGQRETAADATRARRGYPVGNERAGHGATAHSTP